MSDVERKTEQALTDEVSRTFKRNAVNLILNLYTMLRVSRFHSIENQAAQSAVDRLIEVLTELFRAHNRVTIFYSGKDFYINETRIKTTSATFETFDGLTKDFEARDIGKLEFPVCPPRKDLETFAQVFTNTHPKKEENPFKAMEQALERNNIGSIELAKYVGKDWDEMPRIDRTAFIKQSYFRGIQITRQLYRDAREGRPIRLKTTKRVVQNYIDALEDKQDDRADFLVLLTEIKNWQGYLFNHAVNTCILSLAFARALGVNRDALRDLGICAITVDIGNASLDSDVLDKTGPLTDEEWAVIQTHPVRAVHVLANSQDMDTALIRAVMAGLTHHRHHDGGGYPALRFEKHYLFSEIISICDRYDAMTTARPYRSNTLTPPQAVRELTKMAGTVFNPLLIKAFVNWLGDIPVGTIVVLENNQLGMVVSSASRLGGRKKPKIQLLDGSDEGAKKTAHNVKGALNTVPANTHFAKANAILGSGQSSEDS